MLPGRREALYTPPSSPPSSPSSTWVNSSSAPSSPYIEPLSLTEDEHHTSVIQLSSPTIDPLSGSYNAHRAKFARTHSTISTYGAPPKKPRLLGQFSVPEPHHPLENEGKLWDDQVENVFNTGEKTIDLTGQNLTEIPANVIKDFSNMVVLSESSFSWDDVRNNWPSPNNSSNASSSRRPFTRFHTSPASSAHTFIGNTSQKKTQSSSSALGISKGFASIYVGQNRISKLPQELWNVQNLKILSLRNNQISYLPPEIGKLKNLESLNIASNNLSYLPAELMTLKIKSLNIFPNPFILAPKTSTGQSQTVSRTRYTWPSVPPLTELALRVLFSRPQNSHYTVLEHVYSIPLPTGPEWRPISRPLKEILAACAPGSVIVDKCPTINEESSKVPYRISGIGQCPSTTHQGETHIFVQHAEERYSWETVIAGYSLGEAAPLRWRGCQRGCLDFLGPQPADNEEEDSAKMEIYQGEGEEDVEMVQPIFLGNIELSFDDE